MAANETGHEKNIANFNALITYVKSLGDKYKPSKAALKLPALENVYDDIKKSSAALSEAKAPYNKAVDAQEEAFQPLDKLLTRVIKSLRASLDNKAEADTAESLRKKIAGGRKKSVVKDEQPLAAGEKEARTHSTSQRSYDNRSKNLSELIITLKSLPAYAPSEEELSTQTLETMSGDIVNKVQAVIKVEDDVQNARITRDRLLYAPKTGILSIVDDVKEYIGSVFGAGSPESKFINRLTFKKQ